MSTKKERSVLVCTKLKGVFFGYAKETSGDTIKLSRARNIVYWPASQRGFVGLAVFGPLDGAKVGPAADMELREVSCVVEVTPEAVKKWEAAPWN